MRVRSAYVEFAEWAERFHFSFLPPVQGETSAAGKRLQSS